MILLELCHNGALREFLHRPSLSTGGRLPWNLLLRLAIDIVEGMEYLQSKSIIHRYVGRRKQGNVIYL